MAGATPPQSPVVSVRANTLSVPTYSTLWR